MKLVMAMLVFLMVGWHSVDAQSHPQKKRYKPVISIGLGQSNSKINWAVLQVGLQRGSHVLMIGAGQRIPYIADGDNLFYAGRNFRPWFLGGNIEYRRYLPVNSPRFAPFALLGILISGYDVWENPRLFTTSFFAGRQVNFEPKVGYGFNYKFSEFFSVIVQAGAGVDIGKYFRFDGGGYRYMDLGWNGRVGLEKRF